MGAMADIEGGAGFVFRAPTFEQCEEDDRLVYVVGANTGIRYVVHKDVLQIAVDRAVAAIGPRPQALGTNIIPLCELCMRHHLHEADRH